MLQLIRRNHPSSSSSLLVSMHTISTLIRAARLPSYPKYFISFVHKRASLLSREKKGTDASHYASYVTTINGRIIRWYVPSGWNNILFVFIWQNNGRPRCRDLFDMFNTCQPIIDREKNVRLFVPQFSKINPRRNHDFDSYENTIYAFADQAFNKQCLRLPWNSPVEFYFLSPSLSQFVISSSQSKGDGRFFSLEIFLPVAINVANRNRATFHILISAKLMFRFHVLY